MRFAVPAVIPDALRTAARAFGPLAGYFRDQNLGVLAHGNLQSGAALRDRMRHSGNLM